MPYRLNKFYSNHLTAILWLCSEDIICQSRAAPECVPCSSVPLNQMASYSLGAVKAPRKEADLWGEMAAGNQSGYFLGMDHGRRKIATI